jgi:hypothetical protein
LALGKKKLLLKNATAYTWDWYCHLVVDRASLITSVKRFIVQAPGFKSFLQKRHLADFKVLRTVS